MYTGDMETTKMQGDDDDSSVTRENFSNSIDNVISHPRMRLE